MNSFFKFFWAVIINLILASLSAHSQYLDLPFQVPNHISFDEKGPQITIITDKKATSHIVQWHIKHQKTNDELRNKIVQQLFIGMTNKRFYEITQDPEAPFVHAAVNCSTLFIYSLYALPKENEIELSLEVLLLENERIIKFGFTNSELEREKLVLKTYYAQSDKETDKITSDGLISEIKLEEVFEDID